MSLIERKFLIFYFLFIFIFYNFVSVTSAATVIDTVDVGNSAYEIALTPDGQKALVTNVGISPNPNTVTIIDVPSGTITNTITLPGSPYSGVDIAISPDGNTALLSNYTDKTIVVVDIATASIVGSPISVGVSPSSITILPNNKTVLLPNESTCGGTCFQSG